MAEVQGVTKGLEDDSKSIENDPVTTELDNMIRDAGQDSGENESGSQESAIPENALDIENDQDETREEPQTAESNEQEEEAPDINLDSSGKKLISEGGTSVDIDEELQKNNAEDTSGLEMTSEEKEEAQSDSPQKKAMLFDMDTGASRLSTAEKEDAITEKEEPEEQQYMEGSIFDEDMPSGAGMVRQISKPKKFLFSAVLGFRRAKKGIGNFFKKKLPKAFASAAPVAKKILGYTPLAPMVSLIDKVQEMREKSRPERERKAQLKKEAKEKKQAEWLLEQDKKRHIKEEKERIKREKKELKAKLKAELKEKKRLAEAGKKPGFFKRMWNGIKTGAVWIGRRIKNSIVGEAVADGIRQVKEFVQATKVTIAEKISVVTNYIDQTKDEFDEYSFEDRMKRVTEEETRKKQKGEDVPKDDYRTRYLALTEELKGKLSSIKANVTRREQIETALEEMEGKGSKEIELQDGQKEKVDSEDWKEAGTTGTLGWESDLANLALDIGTSLLPIHEKAASAIGNLGKIGSEAARLDKFKKRKEMMDAIKSTSKDTLIRRMAKYAKNNAEIKQMQAGFDIAMHAFSAVEGMATFTGNALIASGAKFANDVTSGIKMLATATKTRKGVKEGIKDMLGGREGYYALKVKYKMHAPEMRRAVRDALGVATSEDAVTADKWELSHLMSERAKSGAKDIETERMVAEAGGSTERKFDALQGAASKIRRRNAYRHRFAVVY